MLNRPRHDWTLPNAPTEVARGLAAAPSARMAGLFVVMALPLLGIGGRLCQLQVELQTGYVAPFSQTRIVLEDLRAREGRILAADGSVLADDVPSYDVLVHYRWLEDPVDRSWLRRKAWERLSRGERRQSAAVIAAEQHVMAERRRLWSDLCEMCGRSPQELTDAGREIQIRVEHIWEDVHARRQAARQSPSAPPAATTSRSAPVLTQWWHTMVEELSRPPERRTAEPLVIKEQEDYHVVWSNVSENVATTIAAHPERFPGVKTRIRTTRVYPQRDLAAHLLGARTPRQGDELTGEATRHLGEGVGRTGLERQYDRELHGRPGRLQQIVNRHGEVIESRVLEPAQHGRDLVLTLDLALQRRAEQLLDKVLESPMKSGHDASPVAALAPAPPPGGCLVAIDVHTGAVLAAAAAPRFDANLLVSPNSGAWSALAADPRKPFYPRMTHMALPPGSVFKAITAAALLESGTLQPDETIPCRGYLDHPGQHRCLIYRHYGVGHGDTDLSQALCQSCNVYFFSGARRAGPQPFVEWARKFGIGAVTGIDLPSETAGTLPEPSQSANGPRRRWHVGDTLGFAIGQSTLTTTPLQIARMMAAIANGGLLVTPHLATTGGPTSLDLSDGEFVRPVFAHPEPQSIPDLRPETLAAIREGLYRVVHDPQGTGYKTVRLNEVTIAGKTGTAEVGGGRPDHAWFAGFTPADNPRVAFAVVIEHGGSGSKTAGPVAREFVRSLLELGLISPTSSLAER